MKNLLLVAAVCQVLALPVPAQTAPAAPPTQLGLPPSGPGVCPSIPVVLARARASAEQGEATGQRQLGTFYAEGMILKQDKVEAYAWLSLAAAKELEALEQGMSPPQIADGRKRAKQLQAQIEARRKAAK